MRKSIAISLLLVYILSTTVVGIRAHYSAGILKSIDLVLDRSSEVKPVTVTKKVTRCKETNEEVVCKKVIVHKVRTTTFYHAPLREVIDYAGKISHGYIQTQDDNKAETPMCDIPVIEKDSASCGC